MLEIIWSDELSRGYVDRIPHSWFDRNKSFEGEHSVVKGRFDGRAKCTVIVRDAVVKLDYKPIKFKEFNVKRNIRLGVVLIVFPESDRKSVPLIYWKPKRQRPKGDKDKRERFQREVAIARSVYG